MDNISNIISNQKIEKNTEENLFVKNIIVNKENKKNEIFPYVSTEKWVKQLGQRLFS